MTMRLVQALFWLIFLTLITAAIGNLLEALADSLSTDLTQFQQWMSP